jgi:sterol desaturase/sphingolipid hydroxylase (fatty acid hydroxylase superfamily)
MIFAAAVASGFIFWGLLEYAIHGFLCHRWKTFVSPMHWAHHSEPRRIFTSPIAVAPIALLIFAIAALAMGVSLASGFVSGALLGFANYERTHWRIHFRLPRNPREQRLRNHHLAHHECDVRAYHGVTTRIWDRVFGTLPANWRADYLKVTDRVPLAGVSNFAQVWNPRTAFKHITRVPKGRSSSK